MIRPFCCASAIALVHRTMPRGAWWISCEPFLVKNAHHVRNSGGKMMRLRLLLRFSNCPGAQNNAARCLVDQLRTLLGEKRPSC